MKTPAAAMAKEAPAKQDGGRSSQQAVQAPQPVFAAPIIIQRKCACGGGCSSCLEEKEESPAIQTKLSLGPASDSYEQEADRIAVQVLRMPAPSPLTHLEDSAARLQRRPLAHEITSLVRTSSGPEREQNELQDEEAKVIEQGRDGVPLPESVLAYMEPRFGADFSAVRLHTNVESARMNDRLHSQAFTHGRDIWLGRGESPGNLSLLAHELTHVVQQSPTLIQQGGATPPTVQRKNTYFSLVADHEGGPGSKTHDFAFAEIAKQNKNKGLLFEVNIPGANKDRVAGFIFDEDAVIGRADIFKASTTIGVKFVGDSPSPEYLDSSRKLRTAGGEHVGISRFEHARLAAPLGKHEDAEIPKKRGGKGKIPKAATEDCPTLEAPAICRMASAPTSIRLGDLKPPSDDEISLGVRQLDSYTKGIHDTAGKVNQFAKANPAKVDDNKSWNPSISRLGDGDVEIPDKFKPNSTAGKALPVVKYRDGRADPQATPKGLQAYLYIIYDTSHPGIWKYEYVPVSIPKDAAETKKTQEKPVADLIPVTDALKAKPDVQMKRKPGLLPPVGRPCIQRRIDKSFDYTSWAPKFKQWQKNDADPFLASRHGRNAELLETLVDIKNRSLPGLAIPSQASQIAVDEQKIRHWDKEGSWYGRLRWIFGDIYVRFGSLYSWVRDRFARLLPSSNEGEGGLGGKVVKVGMKILRFIARTILDQVAERMKAAFRTAAENVVYNLFEKEITEFQEAAKTIREYITDFEATLKQGILDAIEKVIGPFRETFEKIQAIVSKVKDALKWVDRIKWLVRVASCLEPPAFGCLFGILSSELVLALGEYIAGTCRFRKGLASVLKYVPYVKDLPRTIADFLIEKLKGILPNRAQELIGSPRKDEPDLSELSGCEDFGEDPPASMSDLRSRLKPQDQKLFDKIAPNADKDPSEVSKAIAELVQKWGNHPGRPIQALRELLRVRGFGIELPASLSDIQRIDDFFEAIHGDGQAIRKFIASLSKGVELGDKTISRILNETQAYILNPTVTGSVGKIEKQPHPENVKEEEGGVVIFRF
jgi:hypothetical protein